MKGLLQKDFYTLKGTLAMLALFLVVYAALGVVGHNSSMVLAVLAIVVMILPINSISYDEFYHWDRYVLAAPISRKMVVQSKYLLCLLLSAIVLVIGTLFEILMGGAMVDAFCNAWLVAALALLMAMLALPCIFKWGAQKGRLLMVLICGAVGAVLGVALIGLRVNNALLQSVDLLFGNMQQNPMLGTGVVLGALSLVIAIIAAISYKIACRIYLKKEF